MAPKGKPDSHHVDSAALGGGRWEVDDDRTEAGAAAGRADRRGRVRRPVHAPQGCAQGGLAARVVEAGRRRRRHLVLEPLPGRARATSRAWSTRSAFDEALQQEWHWTERYAAQPEMLRYANHVADRFELRDATSSSNTRVTRRAFDEASERWTVEPTPARRWSARVPGDGHRPAVGAEHAGLRRARRVSRARSTTPANWPHEAVDFTGKRVGVIGTGSSAIQSIPLIAQQAAQLTVFQRTPTYAVPAHNGPLDPAFEARIKADYAGFRARQPPDERRRSASELPPQPGVGARGRADASAKPRSRSAGARRLRVSRHLPRPPARQAGQRHWPPSSCASKIRAIVRDPATARAAVADAADRLQAAVRRHRLLRDLQPAQRAAGRRQRASDRRDHADRRDAPDGREYAFDAMVLRHRVRRDDRHAAADRHPRPRRAARCRTSGPPAR